MNEFGARIALVAGSLAAAGLGWFGAKQLGDEEGTSGTALASVDLYDCPSEGVVSIGQVHTGDQVWVIGVTDDRWAVIRHPDSPERPAWMPLALVRTDGSADDLPELSCADATATGTTTATGSSGPPTTVGVTTASSSTTTSSTSTTSTSSTSTTIGGDRIPPTVTVTADREYLYVMTTVAPCSTETALEVTIVVADPTLPNSIRSIIATWDSPAGPQTANLVPVGGNRFRLEVLTNGPATGETPLTLTASGSDGAGNVGTGQLVVALRNPDSFECAG